MLKKILNEISMTFHIEATGPILIKEGDTKEEDSSLMRFVVDANQKIFIPGSSIRGVWRSWCEKIARTISNGVPLACDPFNNILDTENLSCSKRLEKMDTSNVYALSCPICKLFGNTSQGSRIRISDAYIVNGDIARDNLPVRDGIGIDRFTGGSSSGAKFRYQYLSDKTFEAEIHIRNFELWQLGLLGYLFRDFREELIPVGFGKTRGLGKVKGTIEGPKLTFYGLQHPRINSTDKKAEIKGSGSLYTDVDKGHYCFATEAPVEIDFKTASNSAIKTIIELDGDQAESLFMKKSPDYWANVKDDGTPGGYYLIAQEARNHIGEVIEDA